MRWALKFYRRGLRGDGYHLLLVEAERVEVVQNAREDWRARFGEAALALYDDYAAVRGELPLLNDSRPEEHVRNLLRAEAPAPAEGDRVLDARS